MHVSSSIEVQLEVLGEDSHFTTSALVHHSILRKGLVGEARGLSMGSPQHTGLAKRRSGEAQGDWIRYLASFVYHLLKQTFTTGRYSEHSSTPATFVCGEARLEYTRDRAGSPP